MIAQHVIDHEAIYSPSKMIDQFGEGLKKLPVYSLMKAFPDLFLPLFTYSGNVDLDDVIGALYVADDMVLDELLMGYLKQYIMNCNLEGMVF